MSGGLLLDQGDGALEELLDAHAHVGVVVHEVGGVRVDLCELCLFDLLSDLDDVPKELVEVLLQLPSNETTRFFSSLEAETICSLISAWSP